MPWQRLSNGWHIQPSEDGTVVVLRASVVSIVKDLAIDQNVGTLDVE